MKHTQEIENKNHNIIIIKIINHLGNLTNRRDKTEIKKVVFIATSTIEITPRRDSLWL